MQNTAGSVSVFARKVHGPLPMTQVAAMNCFYKEGVVWMRSLAARYQVNIGQGQSLGYVLFKCIQHFLPHLSDEEHLEILAQRAKPSNDEDVAWNDDALHQIVEAGDLDEVKQMADKDKVEKGLGKSLRAEFMELREKIRNASGGGGSEGSAPKKKRKIGGTSASSSNKRYPMPPLETELLPQVGDTIQGVYILHSGFAPKPRLLVIV